ncbi:hypothetical protein G5V58_21310 [Nocardioides anomalus]|uniref:Uncharacterized protein n=1 Tax=Nocardioides anomalus TaxID=2712223 RepID=A0A6G6WIS9_9ACTN|nr:hypothetical protein [Nocardioides anomalus]QIG44970.1 hypothetical protein G5V58_21310 [Nocardioides anomalus]
MTTTSRGMRESVVRALARVGLVWAVFVLGALFVLTGAHAPALAGGDDHAPRTVGLALTALVLTCGVGVLAVGVLRREDGPPPLR